MIIRPFFGLRVTAPLARVLTLAFIVALVALMPLTAAGLVASAVGGVGAAFAGGILDAQQVLSDAQAISATAVSTNTYDTGAAGNSVDIGEPLAAVISVDVTAGAGGANETYQFQVIQSANANLSSQDVLLQTDTSFITRTILVAGYKLVIPIPPGLKSKRYLGVRVVLAGTTPTLTFTADIRPMSMLQNDKIYPKGYTISS